ncbi:MAG: KH domain-containing protein [Clostridia bacterium]|nr:KH domain-containing protein [Clostridia bacterium]
MKDLVKFIAQSLVEFPQQVVVTQKEDGDNITIELKVAPEDMGKVIGKHGKIARAIRCVTKAAASKQDKHVNVEIL